MNGNQKLATDMAQGLNTQSKRGMTVKEAMRAIRALGMSVSRTPHGEFRVTDPRCPRDKQEDRANYCEDAEDAVRTAQSIKEWGDQNYR